MLFVGKWMELEIIMLSEISQVRRNKYHMCSLIFGISRGKNYDHKRDVEEGENGRRGKKWQ
jgi:hypothetical protein